MRSVIREPETMFVVAAVMATKPSTLLMVVASSLVMIRIAPTTEMAEIALVSDISGVWSRGDTLRITSRPTKVASMKTYSPISRFEGIALPLHRRGQSQHFPHLWMHHFPALRDQRFAHDLVLSIERKLTVLDQVFEKGRDVLGIHLARVIRNGGRQIQRPHD